MSKPAFLLLAFLTIGVATVFAQDAGIAVSPSPGSYDHNLLVAFSSPSGTISYSISIIGAASSAPVGGSSGAASAAVPYMVPILLSALPGEARTYRIEATAGAKTAPLIAQFTIDRVEVQQKTEPKAEAAAAKSARAALSILSPAAGTFVNKQLLYVEDSGFDWIKYTTDGSDPRTGGIGYTGPTMIDATGKVILRVAGLAFGQTTPTVATVSFAVKPSAGAPTVSTSSGSYRDPVSVILPNGGRFVYTFREHEPDTNDIPYEAPIEISAPDGAISYTPLRVRQELSDGSWGPEARYFYVVDRRGAPDPRIALQRGEIATPRTTVMIQSAAYTSVRYTTDGQEPDSTSSLYTNAFALSLPENSTGEVTVKARAFAPNGDASSVVSRTFPFSTKLPSPPDVTIGPAGSSNGAEAPAAADGGAPVDIVHIVSAPGSDLFGARVVYERTFDGSTPKDPGVDSPTAVSDMALSVPAGVDATVQLKFATVDRAGEVSLPTKVYSVRLDRSPPAAPAISFAGDRLTIEGEGTIRYVLTDTGAPPAAPGPTSPRYFGPRALQGAAGERTEYYVAAVAYDESGNQSSERVGGPYIVDRRAPELPEYWGVANGGLYNTARTLSFRTSTGLSVHFTQSDDTTVPPDPTLSSPTVASSLTFSAAAGQSKRFAVKLLPVIGESAGKVTTISFVIDRVPPVVAVPSGAADGGVYDHAIVLSPPEPVAGSHLFISVSDSSKPADPLGSEGMPFGRPITFDISLGSELKVSYLLGARDDAGNQTEDPVIHSFTIDKIAPPPPILKASTDASTSEAPVTVMLNGSGNGESYRYEITEDGSLPAEPTADSPEYHSPLVLRGSVGKEIVYTIAVASFDAAGNVSTLPAYYRVLVAVPERSSGISAAPSLPEHTAATAAPPAGTSLSAPFVTGVVDKAVYNTAQTLLPAVKEGVLRYTIDANGGTPPEVTSFSPELPAKLHLDPALGETRKYTLNLKLSASADASQGIASQTLRFIIDRTPPFPPLISGIADNSRYESPRTITLASSEGTIYYAVDKLGPDASAGTEFTRYTGPVTIGAGESGIARYRIRAYTVDEAGNHSLATPEWTVYFDHGVVYASPDGNDLNAGTSAAPVRTLARAAAIAVQENRRTVILADGTYTVAQPFVAAGGLGILGGFDASTWKEGTSRAAGGTELMAGTGIPDGAPLFQVSGGGFSMGSLHIRNDHAASSTILVTGGSLSLSDVRIDSGSPEVGAIVLRGGRAQIDGSTIATSGGAPLLRADGGELSVTDSTLVGGTTPSEESLVVLSGGASADLLHTKLESGSALRIAAVRADHATLSIEGGELSSGIATASAVGLLSQSSSVSLKDTAIRSSSDSRLTFGIQAVGSKLTVDGVTIDARGQVGATGVYADNSTVSINAATIRGAQTSEFLYLVKLVGSQAALTNSLLTGARSGDFLAVGLTRSTGYVVDNTLFGGEGRDRLAALLLESSPGVNVADNIFARVPTSAAGQQPGVAILVRASTFVGAILSNDFSGYAAVYEDGAGKRADVGALDRSDGNEKGGSFAGNVTEAPIATFAAAGDFHLTPGSLCRGSGVDPARFGAPATDIEGTKRSGRFDIGAYFGR